MVYLKLLTNQIKKTYLDVTVCRWILTDSLKPQFFI